MDPDQKLISDSKCRVSGISYKQTNKYLKNQPKHTNKQTNKDPPTGEG